jgi:NAD(P)-dependent dehydrogenase (short-subunit alcohol dehydrogenase family)
MQFENKTVLISGGSSEIGLAAARKFAHEGANVAILARGVEPLKKAEEELRKISAPEKVLAVSCDMTDENAVISAFKQVIERFGRLDILVNNAGSGSSAPIEDTTLALWNEMIAVHATGYFLAAREAVRTFKRQGGGGVMVFVVSDNAVRPSRNFIAYNVAKAGELHMARSIADECGQDGIRVNSILPGAVFGGSGFWTPELRAQRAGIYGFDPDKLAEEYKKNAALNVVIEPDEVADLILFLASDKTAKITGAVISIDGGGKGGYVR